MRLCRSQQWTGCEVGPGPASGVFQSELRVPALLQLVTLCGTLGIGAVYQRHLEIELRQDGKDVTTDIVCLWPNGICICIAHGICLLPLIGVRGGVSTSGDPLLLLEASLAEARCSLRSGRAGRLAASPLDQLHP